MPLLIYFLPGFSCDVTSACQVVLLVGDLTYSDAYHSNGVLRHPHPPTTPFQETYQPRWDAWGRLMAPLASEARPHVSVIPVQHLTALIWLLSTASFLRIGHVLRPVQHAKAYAVQGDDLTVLSATADCRGHSSPQTSRSSTNNAGVP